jgi:xanthine/uracil permease
MPRCWAASWSAACSTPPGLFIGRIRFALPPLVTGLVVTMIGLALVKVGIQYAAGGVPAIGTSPNTARC